MKKEINWQPYPCNKCGEPAFYFAKPMPPGVTPGKVVEAICSKCCSKIDILWLGEPTEVDILWLGEPTEDEFYWLLTGKGERE